MSELRTRRCLPALCFLVLAWGSDAQFTRADNPPPEGVEFFEKKIRPLLVKHCYECHSAESDDVKGDLRVDSREGLRKGGNTGPAVVPNDPDASVLIQAVRYDEDAYQMPPAGKLPDEAIADLVRWVEMGAPDPRDGAPPGNADKSSVAAEHWAFQPLRRAPAPQAQDGNWVRDPIDAFVFARLASQSIATSPDADRPTLIRRVYFDLVGLPPSYDEVEAFVGDQQPGAYERLVDRLLDSPQFGERWGRHWLDIARYADTKGYVFQEDRSYAEAYTYRDWVIESLNNDLPFDLFLKYQLAADRLPQLDGSDIPSQAAMGYLTLGRRFLNNKHDIIDDRIDVVTRGMMALTVSCARCHDHKYDPIPQEDYYSLYGIFDSSHEPKDAPSPLRLVDKDDPHDARVLLRGSPGNPGPVVPRRFLKVLSGHERKPFHDGSGRLQLAEAITAHDNPLTARVFVNRVWWQLFGAGLVDTPSDFGVRSDPPVHPDVLDELAVGFREDGWSRKRLIRRIVLSSTYRQSSAHRVDASAIDPENQLFWRQNVRRVDLESLRDAVLAVSGGLEHSLGGASVEITKEPYSGRRTVYAFIDRQNLPGVFRAFDFATPDTHSPRRLETTTPQQSLFLMNHPFVMQQAERLVQFLGSDGGPTDANVRSVFRRVLARDPDAEEIANGLEFVQASRAADLELHTSNTDLPLLPAWARYAQVLMLSNEFQFVD